MADLLCERAHLRHLDRVLPQRRAYSLAANDGRDFYFVTRSIDVASIGGVRLTPLFDVTVVAVARRGLKLSGKADLATLGEIAFPAGSPPERGYMVDPSWHLHAVPSVDNALRMLNAGRVDAVLDVDFVIDDRAAALGLTAALGDRVEVYGDGVDLAATAEAASTPEAAALRQAAEELAPTGIFRSVSRAEFEVSEHGQGKPGPGGN